MAHSSEMLWGMAENLVADSAKETLSALYSAELIYLELLEIYQYAGGTDQLFADLLFSDVIAQEARNPAEANTTEVAKITDLRLAIQALHELWEGMTNIAIAQSDRATALRRMS